MVSKPYGSPASNEPQGQHPRSMGQTHPWGVMKPRRAGFVVDLLYVKQELVRGRPALCYDPMAMNTGSPCPYSPQ